MKVHASAHSNKLHLYEINDQGLVIGDPLTGYEGLLSGHPTVSGT